MSDATVRETRQRLLDAAGEVFAERGFRAATVRDICQRARANIAAVNYHFGDKERLYTAVLRYAFGCALEQYPPLLDLDGDASPEQRLRAFIRSFMLRCLGEGNPAWLGKLMAREMAEPTHALDILIQEAFHSSRCWCRSWRSCSALRPKRSVCGYALTVFSANACTTVMPNRSSSDSTPR
jgi:AcrR family transcriptional regulator